MKNQKSNDTVPLAVFPVMFQIRICGDALMNFLNVYCDMFRPSVRSGTHYFYVFGLVLSFEIGRLVRLVLFPDSLAQNVLNDL
jgi:hypothetical protein